MLRHLVEPPLLQELQQAEAGLERNDHSEDSGLDGILSLGSRVLSTQPTHQYIFFPT